MQLHPGGGNTLMTYEKVDGEKFKALMENLRFPFGGGYFVPLQSWRNRPKAAMSQNSVVGEEPPVEEYPADPLRPRC